VIMGGGGQARGGGMTGDGELVAVRADRGVDVGAGGVRAGRGGQARGGGTGGEGEGGGGGRARWSRGGPTGGSTLRPGRCGPDGWCWSGASGSRPCSTRAGRSPRARPWSTCPATRCCRA